MNKIKFYSAKHTSSTGILFYMTICIHSDSFTWRQTALFQFAVSRGPRVQSSVLQLIKLFYSPHSVRVLEMFFLGSQTVVTSNQHVVNCTFNFKVMLADRKRIATFVR